MGAPPPDDVYVYPPAVWTFDLEVPPSDKSPQAILNEMYGRIHRAIESTGQVDKISPACYQSLAFGAQYMDLVKEARREERVIHYRVCTPGPLYSLFSIECGRAMVKMCTGLGVSNVTLVRLVDVPDDPGNLPTGTIITREPPEPKVTPTKEQPPAQQKEDLGQLSLFVLWALGVILFMYVRPALPSLC